MVDKGVVTGSFQKILIIFHLIFYIAAGWIICIGMLNWGLNYIFSDILIAIFEPVLIILSKIE